MSGRINLFAPRPIIRVVAPKRRPVTTYERKIAERFGLVSYLMTYYRRSHDSPRCPKELKGLLDAVANYLADLRADLACVVLRLRVNVYVNGQLVHLPRALLLHHHLSLLPPGKG